MTSLSKRITVNGKQLRSDLAKSNKLANEYKIISKIGTKKSRREDNPRENNPAAILLLLFPLALGATYLTFPPTILGTPIFPKYNPTFKILQYSLSEELISLFRKNVELNKVPDPNDDILIEDQRGSIGVFSKINQIKNKMIERTYFYREELIASIKLEYNPNLKIVININGDVRKLTVHEYQEGSSYEEKHSIELNKLREEVNYLIKLIISIFEDNTDQLAKKELTQEKLFEELLKKINIFKDNEYLLDEGRLFCLQNPFRINNGIIDQTINRISVNILKEVLVSGIDKDLFSKEALNQIKNVNESPDDKGFILRFLDSVHYGTDSLGTARPYYQIVSELLSKSLDDKFKTKEVTKEEVNKKPVLSSDKIVTKKQFKGYKENILVIGQKEKVFENFISMILQNICSIYSMGTILHQKAGHRYPKIILHSNNKEISQESRSQIITYLEERDAYFKGLFKNQEAELESKFLKYLENVGSYPYSFYDDFITGFFRQVINSKEIGLDLKLTSEELESKTTYLSNREYFNLISKVVSLKDNHNYDSSYLYSGDTFFLENKKRDRPNIELISYILNEKTNSRFNLDVSLNIPNTLENYKIYSTGIENLELVKIDNNIKPELKSKSYNISTSQSIIGPYSYPYLSCENNKISNYNTGNQSISSFLTLERNQAIEDRENILSLIPLLKILKEGTKIKVLDTVLTSHYTLVPNIPLGRLTPGAYCGIKNRDSHNKDNTLELEKRSIEGNLQLFSHIRDNLMKVKAYYQFNNRNVWWKKEEFLKDHAQILKNVVYPEFNIQLNYKKIDISGTSSSHSICFNQDNSFNEGLLVETDLISSVQDKKTDFKIPEFINAPLYRNEAEAIRRRYIIDYLKELANTPIIDTQVEDKEPGIKNRLYLPYLIASLFKKEVLKNPNLKYYVNDFAYNELLSIIKKDFDNPVFKYVVKLYNPLILPFNFIGKEAKLRPKKPILFNKNLLKKETDQGLSLKEEYLLCLPKLEESLNESSFYWNRFLLPNLVGEDLSKIRFKESRINYPFNNLVTKLDKDILVHRSINNIPKTTLNFSSYDLLVNHYHIKKLEINKKPSFFNEYHDFKLIDKSLKESKLSLYQLKEGNLTQLKPETAIQIFKEKKVELEFMMGCYDKQTVEGNELVNNMTDSKIVNLSVENQPAIFNFKNYYIRLKSPYKGVTEIEGLKGTLKTVVENILKDKNYKVINWQESIKKKEIVKEVHPIHKNTFFLFDSNYWNNIKQVSRVIYQN